VCQGKKAEGCASPQQLLRRHYYYLIPRFRVKYAIIGQQCHLNFIIHADEIEKTFDCF
jgi:hypothetical protein